MSSLDKIYKKMPVTIQDILISTYGVKLYRERYGTFYKDKMSELLSRNTTAFDYEEYQRNELYNFLKYAKENSPYYAERIPDLGSKEDFSLEFLNNVPITDKEALRENIDKIVTVEKSKAIKGNTGGTTGKSLIVYYTKKDMQERMALLDYFKYQHGVYKGMRRASFTGKDLTSNDPSKPVYWRNNRILNQLLFSTFYLNDKNIPYYIEALNNFKPESMDGFPTSMIKIAKYILRNDITLSFSPKAIFPTAETLLSDDKEVLEKAFNTKVRDQYASSEGAPFITECINGKLHLQIDTGVFEKVEEGNISEILVTSFTTHGTPLIRYRIGDKLEFTEEGCSCGQDTPIVKRIIGRNSDYLYSRERGKVYSANMSNIVKYIPYSVKQIQLIQNTLDKIIVKIVPDKNLYKEEHTQLIINELSSRLGKQMKFVIDLVEEIPTEKSGKTRFIKNTLKG